MIDAKPVLGIDVSKRKFDVCLITTAGAKEKYRTFSNDVKGFEDLATFLKKLSIDAVHACMEPTGHYGDDLALWLYDQKHKVSIVNSYRIKGFAISELKRSKTDRIDAGIIARFCQMHAPSDWSPRAPELQELQDLGRYVDALKDTVLQERNRLTEGNGNPTVCRHIEHHIRFLTEEIASLESRMLEIVKANKRLNQAYECATSIIGVGAWTALTFLGEIGYGDQFQSARQVEAFCGLNPRLRTSGTSLCGKPRISKMGNARIRKVLYMPALCAMQHNPVIRDYAYRLRAAGKVGKVIVGAIMRKLVRLLFAVVTTGQLYDLGFHAQAKNKIEECPIT